MTSYVSMMNLFSDSVAVHRSFIDHDLFPNQGFNDLGHLGCSTTSSPTMDSLIRDEGLLLWHNYAFKMCSPSRSAFLSGRNPSTLGLQNLMFSVEYPTALTRSVSVLSEEFKANGYSTHIIGYGIG